MPFFSRKQMLQVLKDEEVVKFILIYYQRLESVSLSMDNGSSIRTSFPRDEQERRLEALARLTVGDETCSAVGFDDNKLLIATNKAAHENIVINYTLELELHKGQYVMCYVATPILHITIGNRDKITMRHADALYLLPYLNTSTRNKIFKPHTLKNGRIASCSFDDYQVCEMLEFKIFPEDHCIPNLPNISVKASLCQDMPIEYYHEQTQTLPHNVISNTPFDNLKISIDPLHRRTEILLEHLSFVVKANNHPEILTREEAARIVEHNRYRFLINSLVWEITQWYEQFIISKDAERDSRQGDTRRADQEKINEHNQLQLLVEQLNKHFSEFKLLKKVTIVNSEFINSWVDVISRLINENLGYFAFPKYILEQEQINKLLIRSKKYFKDIEQLELFICNNADRNGTFFAVIGRARPTEIKDMVEVIDDLEGEVHAEIRLLWKSHQTNKPLSFVAISKYSCPHCGLFFHQCGQRIPGLHGKIFPKWPLGNLVDDEGFLLKLFGANLYSEYKKLLNINVRGIDGQQTNKGAVVIAAIQSIGTLNKKDITETFNLGKIYFKNDEEDYASDTDEEALSIEQVQTNQAACYTITEERPSILHQSLVLSSNAGNVFSDLPSQTQIQQAAMEFNVPLNTYENPLDIGNASAFPIPKTRHN